MSIERVSPKWIKVLDDDEVFVFGSNMSGQHMGGAAKIALDWGAVWGEGVGLFGQTYAIPTMHGGVEEIKPYVDDFIDFAKQYPELKFLVTEIGCGIAGFSVDEMAPLFKVAVEDEVSNIYLPQSFVDAL